jgi:hypothetical protein
MATKKEKEAAAKKRKGGTAAPKAVSEEAVLGTISIPVQAWIDATSGPFDELVIEWGCLGLSEEPDSIVDTSGNSGLLDPKRPPKTDEEGLHIYFHPPLSADRYGFNFLFSYNEAVLARMAPPKEEKEAA